MSKKNSNAFGLRSKTLAAAALALAGFTFAGGCASDGPGPGGSPSSRPMTSTSAGADSATAAAHQYSADEMMPVEEAWKKLGDDTRQQSSDIWLPVKVRGPGGDVVGNINRMNREKAAKARAQAKEHLANARSGKGDGMGKALETVIERAADRLAVELPEARDVKESRNKMVLVTSELTDPKFADTRIASAFQALESRIVQSKAITASFAIVNRSPDDAAKVMKRAGAGEEIDFNDALTGEGNAAAAKYHPDAVYVIHANAYAKQANDHTVDVRVYLTVTHARTRQIVTKVDQNGQLMFHPYRMGWVTAEENAELRRTYAATQKPSAGPSVPDVLGGAAEVGGILFGRR